MIEATGREVDVLLLLSEVLNYGFAAKPLDEPFTDDELAGLSFQGFRDRVLFGPSVAFLGEQVGQAF